MNKLLITRLVQTLAVLVCAVAPLLAYVLVSHLARIYMPYYSDLLKGQALPAQTLFVLAWAYDYRLVSLFVLAGIVCLAAAYWLGRSAANPEACSFRLLLFVSILWMVCFVLLAAAMFAFALPFIGRTAAA